MSALTGIESEVQLHWGCNLADYSDSELTEQTIESQRLFTGRILNLRVDTVRLSNGRESTREIVEHAGAAAAIPLLADDQVVLVRQWRQPVRQVLVEIPAGVVEKDESPEDCMCRELAEEIGYQPGRLQLLFTMYLAPGYSEELIHIFLADDLQPIQATADYDENLQVKILPFAEAVNKCLRGEIKDAKTIAGLLTVAARRGLKDK